jgi:hypothetical protein
MTMKFTWKGKWRNGEISIEAETFQELENALKTLSASEETQASEISDVSIPEIVAQGCSEATRMLMETEWGKRPRSMNEIKKALETNALYFSKGTLSGTLTAMVKKGELHRVKEDGRWKYYIK